MNNYDYNRTLLLMNRTEHLANEIIMLQENTAISSPVSILYYERFENVKSLSNNLSKNLTNIQCIVYSESLDIYTGFANFVKFGNTQRPELWDYADNVDILKFLFSLKSLN
jgi:hypothetical protein